MPIRCLTFVQSPVGRLGRNVAHPIGSPGVVEHFDVGLNETKCMETGANDKQVPGGHHESGDCLRRLARPMLAEGLSNDAFSAAPVEWRGKTKYLLVWSRPVLWYTVDKANLVLLVIVRDPAGIMHDDFFFTTELDTAPGDVASRYAGRWSIECVNREVKQCLGAEDPQCWKREGPERAASLSLWLYAAIWTWYIPTFGTTASWIPRRWYPKKATPRFLDALASLRRVLWAERITPVSSSEPLPREILDGLLDALATAARAGTLAGLPTGTTTRRSTKLH